MVMDVLQPFLIQKGIFKKREKKEKKTNILFC